ncbi:hypothetical protein HHI36_019914 [Cryptolaemus montrouzieri]|uniref:Reverse transcriptase domain-containing protein n=1 Tax=Cryptolaemus montrouzieri TaxID=559131 RepID=A0ABD2N8R0_9CUCU
MYAEDTFIVLSEDDESALNNKIVTTVHHLDDWFRDNNLLLNVAKTHLIKFFYQAPSVMKRKFHNSYNEGYKASGDADGQRIKTGDSSCVSAQNSSAVSKSYISADAAPITMREFHIMMATLNDFTTNITSIRDDISTIRATQQKLSIQVSQCAADIRKHDLMLSSKVQDFQTANRISAALSTEVSEIKVTVSDVQNQAAIFSTDVASLQTSTNHIDCIEILDRIRRSHNIMIRHVPDKQDSASDDLTVRAIDFLSPGSSQDIVATSRLGDAEKRMPRLLLVTFNPIITRKLLRNKKMLSTTDNFRTFSISDDVSPQ